MRLIQPGPPDLNAGPDARLRRVAACHEAGHAIAAYHLRFPIVRVRFQEPRNGQIANTHVETDNTAFQIGKKYLTGIGAGHQRILVSFCAVMAIARWTNIEVNHLDVREAEGCSSGDYRSIADFLAKLPLNPQQQIWFVRQGEAEALRIIALPGYRDALDAVAERLIHSLVVRDNEVVETIEQTVGHQLRSAARDPLHEEVAFAAYYLHLDRFRSNQAADSLDDWIVAERGIKFGIASAP